MRALNTADIFGALRIIKEIDLKEQLQAIAKKSQEDKQDIEEIGANLLFKMLELMTDQKSEKKIYEFLAGPFEVTAQEIENMPIDRLMENIVELNEVSNIRGFFTSLSRLITLKSSTSYIQDMGQSVKF